MIYDKQTIYGQPPSKSNSYKIGVVAGHGMMYKPKALKEYEKNFFLQCSLRGFNIQSPIKITLWFYFRSFRSDLDNGEKAVLDCLQQCGAIKNDNLVVEKHSIKFVDKKNPRVEFIIETDDNLKESFSAS